MLLPRLDIPFSKQKGLLAAGLGIISDAIVAAPVGASDQARQPETARPDALDASCYSMSSSRHCYAFAETDGFIADGAAARFDSRQYVTQDWQKGGFTEQTLWVGVESSVPDDEAEWCEVGWTKGWVHPTTREPQASVSHYYAFSVNGDYSEAFPASPAVGPHGTSHHYQVLREYDGKYNFYIDNIDVGDCHADPFTLWAQVGLEYTHPFNGADQNDPRELEWRRSTDLSWFDWGAFSTRVDAYEWSDHNRAHWNWETYPTSGENWIGP